MRPLTNLSSRAQPRDLVSLNLTPARQAGAPSFRVLCGKVGNENLDQRTPSTSETGQGEPLPEIELPTLEKAQGLGQPPAVILREAESRPRDSPRMTSALSAANQCRPERPSSRRPETICHPERSRGTLCLPISPHHEGGAPSFRLLLRKGG